MTAQVFVYVIDPVGKVRQTQSDRWKKRPCVVRYRMFADRLRELGCTLEPGDSVEFQIAMPKSWSERKRGKLKLTLHTQKPDLDNLLGGLMDAVLPEGDSHISEIGGIRKLWHERGAIVITRHDPDPGSSSDP